MERDKSPTRKPEPVIFPPAKALNVLFDNRGVLAPDELDLVGIDALAFLKTAHLADDVFMNGRRGFVAPSLLPYTTIEPPPYEIPDLLVKPVASSPSGLPYAIFPFVICDINWGKNPATVSHDAGTWTMRIQTERFPLVYVQCARYGPHSPLLAPSMRLYNASASQKQDFVSEIHHILPRATVKCRCGTVFKTVEYLESEPVCLCPKQ